MVNLPEFGELAILIALQNALTSDQLAGSSTEDLNAFAQIFTAELGEAIKQAGTEDPSAISQSMLNLVTKWCATPSESVSSVECSQTERW